MRALVLIVIVGVSCVLAQEQPPQPPAVDPQQALMMQVQQEEMMARQFLEISLKLQHSQYTSMAAMMYSHMLMLEYQENNGDMSLEEDASTLFGENTNNGWGFDVDTNKRQVQLDLLASYYLLFATRVKILHTIYKASDVQREFWMDRAMQLFVSASGGMPPQFLQLFYMKMYRTNLETIKLAMAFQYLNHFVSWLEDAIDVNSALADESNPHGESVALDNADDLIRDKQYAFTAYHSHAMLDFQIFYIDMYLEAAMGMGGPPANMSASSFLEEEMEAEPAEPAEPNKFFPMMAAGNPMMFMKIYKMYFLMFQMHAAQSALTSVYAEKMAYEKETSGDDGEQFRTFAQQMFGGGFAMNLLHAAQLERFSAMWEMWAMYAPMYAGMAGGV